MFIRVSTKEDILWFNVDLQIIRGGCLTCIAGPNLFITCFITSDLPVIIKVLLKSSIIKILPSFTYMSLEIEYGYSSLCVRHLNQIMKQNKNDIHSCWLKNIKCTNF